MGLNNRASSNQFARCAGLIHEADSLFITTGTGMGVDSSLPYFRGQKGFWGVCPELGGAFQVAIPIDEYDWVTGDTWSLG